MLAISPYRAVGCCSLCCLFLLRAGDVVALGVGLPRLLTVGVGAVVPSPGCGSARRRVSAPTSGTYSEALSGDREHERGDDRSHEGSRGEAELGPVGPLDAETDVGEVEPAIEDHAEAFS